MKTLKTDQAIITLLKLSRVDRIICDTDKGVLKLCLRKEENNYFFTLDATELPKELNKELMELLFPVIVTEYNNPKPLLADTSKDSNVAQPVLVKKTKGKSAKK